MIRMTSMNFSKVSIAFPICIIGILSLYQLLYIGYTTADDVGIGLESYQSFFNKALSSNRLTWVMSVPYEIFGSIQGDSILSKIPRLVGIVIMVISLQVFFNEFFSKKSFGIFNTFLILCLWNNSWQHNGFTSYPFLFTFSIANFFLSLTFYGKYLKTRSSRSAILTFILLPFSFTSEVFVSLIWLHFLYRIHLSSELMIKLPQKVNFYNSYKDLLLFLVPTLIFTICYFKFSNGSQVYKSGTFSGFLECLWTYTISGIPLMAITDVKLNSLNWYNFLCALIKGIAVIFILFLFEKRLISKVNFRDLKKIIVTSVVFAFSVNILIAYTERYQSWVNFNSSTSYIYTMFSNIGFITSISCLTYMLTSINSEFGNRLKKIVIILLGLLTSMVSLQNDYFFQQQYIAQKPWKYVDQILNNVYFKELSPNTILLAPKLFITHGNVDISGIENYWTRYIEYKIQKKLIIKERLVLEDFSQDSKVYQLAFGFENSWNEINNNHQFSNKLLFLQGMSAIENGMLWTDNTNAELFFKELLPKEFILTIASNGAFGPNGGALFKVKVGGDEKIFEGPGGMSTINLKFKPHFATNVISINIPTPTAPSEISDSKDHRLLGLSITGVKINRLDNEIKLLLGY